MEPRTSLYGLLAINPRSTSVAGACSLISAAPRAIGVGAGLESVIPKCSSTCSRYACCEMLIVPAFLFCSILIPSTRLASPKSFVLNLCPSSAFTLSAPSFVVDIPVVSSVYVLVIVVSPPSWCEHTEVSSLDRQYPSSFMSLSSAPHQLAAPSIIP